VQQSNDLAYQQTIIVLTPASISPVAWLSLGIALFGAGLAVTQTRFAREAFLGQNFLTLMEKLQADGERTARASLKAYLYGEVGDRSPLQWHGSTSSTEALAADRVSQLFDQVGILIDARMVDAAAILDNWSPTIIEAFIVALPVIHERRKTNEHLWRSFDRLVDKAHRNTYVPDSLRSSYGRLMALIADSGVGHVIANNPDAFTLTRS